MHHARGAADADRPLRQAREGASHRDQAPLDLVDLLHLDLQVLQPPLEPLAELVEPDGGPGDQRGLLQEDLGRGEGHRVQERRDHLVGRPHLGGATGVVVAPVHEEHRVEREGVAVDGGRDPVRALVARVERLVPLDQLAGVARGVEDDAGLDFIVRGRGRFAAAASVCAASAAPSPSSSFSSSAHAQRRVRAAVLDALGPGLHERHAVVDAARQKSPLQLFAVDSAVGPPQLALAGLGRVEEDVRPGPNKLQAVFEAHGLELVAPHAVGVGPGGQGLGVDDDDGVS